VLLLNPLALFVCHLSLLFLAPPPHRFAGSCSRPNAAAPRAMARVHLDHFRIIFRRRHSHLVVPYSLTDPFRHIPNYPP